MRQAMSCPGHLSTAAGSSSGDCGYWIEPFPNLVRMKESVEVMRHQRCYFAHRKLSETWLDTSTLSEPAGLSNTIVASEPLEKIS